MQNGVKNVYLVQSFHNYENVGPDILNNVEMRRARKSVGKVEIK